MYTFHNLLAAMHLDYGVDNFKKRFPYHWLRSSWYHYLNLLDIDYSTGFICPKCGKEPRIIVCDATSLAFRRELLPTKDRHSPASAEHSVLNGWYGNISTCHH